ncbi:hypothetical protein [Aquimarina spinulae]|uniref:hypothetical protein n=1 Tax=Aquimarina spinulae TaxID=1192023 RepID=UPI000D561414|nr:hypothetical protein [Aquimarina spinulae]
MEINELIELMSGVKDGNEAIGNKTLSWEAYRAAEQLNDTSLITEINTYIKNDDNETTRKYAYDILMYIGRNAGAGEATNILIGQIKVEDYHDDNLHNVLDALYSINIPLQKGLDEILIYAFDERELIRTTAIQLLSRYTIEYEKIKGALMEVIEYHYDEYDLKYAIESLQVLFPDDYRNIILKKIEELKLNNKDENTITMIKTALNYIAIS